MSRYWIFTIIALFIAPLLLFSRDASASQAESNPLIAFQAESCITFSEIRSDRMVGEAVKEQMVSIPPGEYDITLTSYDDHSAKSVDQKQTQESWRVEFWAGDNKTVESAPTPDLPETEDSLTIHTQLSITEHVDKIKVVHAAYYNSSPNSVVPTVCWNRRADPSMVQVEGVIRYSTCRDGVEIRDAPLSGIAVHLQPASLTHASDNNGLFQFPPQDEGSYELVLSLANELMEAKREFRSFDRDGMRVDFYTINLVLEGVTCPPEIIDAGIGDFVWLDRDKDGIQDSDEPGVSGVAVILSNLDTGQTWTTATNDHGKYLFSDLVPGNYQLQFIPPAGYAVTEPNMGDDRMDSDIFPANGRTDTTTLDPFEQDLSWDAGIHLTSNRVACTRFNLELGRDSKTGSVVPGVYKMFEHSTGSELASWEAKAGWKDSGWLEDIKLAHADGTYVEVYFYPTSGTPGSVKLEIINPAPGTSFGWLSPGICHAIELQFPQGWESGATLVQHTAEAFMKDTAVAETQAESITAAATQKSAHAAASSLFTKGGANSLFRSVLR